MSPTTAKPAHGGSATSRAVSAATPDVGTADFIKRLESYVATQLKPNPSPNSDDVDFFAKWKDGPDDLDIDQIVKRWHSQER